MCTAAAHDCLRRTCPILRCGQQGLTRSAAAGTCAALQEGWQLVVQSEEVLQCYSSPWDARYHSGLLFIGGGLQAAQHGWGAHGLQAKQLIAAIQVQPFIGVSGLQQLPAEWAAAASSSRPVHAACHACNLPACVPCRRGCGTGAAVGGLQHRHAAD